ncbi:MAG TPA: hypothetical protein DD381_02585 [Lentisphaeria bacterium]|nr:MAG: hypothetical protein A2X47_03665 [Lentisphaerae bacterium GWF2_38_69]HBM15222.1 hypothetical protein [Lentisphaeria bacterium]
MISIALIIICLMIILNGFFAAFELALTSISSGRLKYLSEQKTSGAASALRMRTRSEASLAVIQIGITIIGAITAAIGGAEATEDLIPYLNQFASLPKWLIKVIAIALVVAPLSAVTIIIGELVPKTIGLRHNEKICLLLSPVMEVFSSVLYPLVIIFEWSTKRIVRLFEKNLDNFSPIDLGIVELRAQARALTAEKIINPFQEKMIIGASNLAKIKLSDILIPAEEIVMLYAEANLADHFVTAHLESFTRFPITEKVADPQSIIGYANIKEIIFLAKTHPANPNIREITRPIQSYQSTMSIGEAFTMMMREHIHLALVKDKNGKVLGMVTLEDILEEVTGDIQDEFDRLPKHITSSGKQFVVGGGVNMAILASRTNKLEILRDLEKPNMNFSEWVKSNHDKKKINGGDVIHIDGYTVLIRKVRRNQVLEALFSVN